MSLQFGGLGEVVQRTNGGWVGGGFGIGGALEGVALAGALNVLSSSQTITIDSVITMQWRTGQVVISSSEFAPATLAHFMEPIVQRLRTEQATARPVSLPTGTVPVDVAQLLTQLAALHASGALSDEEFAQAKQRVLRG